MRRICSWHECRNPFETAREDARFCSNNCRAKANKAKHRADAVPPEAAAAVTPTARPERAAPTTAEPSPTSGKKWMREDFSFSADQGDYHPDERDVIPATPVGRIARLEDRLHDMEQDFDLAEPERRSWERLRPKVEALLAVGKAAAPVAAAVAPSGLTPDQVTSMIRTEVNSVLKSWRDRILQHDQLVAGLREDVDRLARSASSMKAPPVQTAPANGSMDKRVVAKITEFEAALGGVRERLDAVEYDTGRLMVQVALIPNAEDDGDEEEQDDSWADEDGDEDDDAA